MRERREIKGETERGKDKENTIGERRAAREEREKQQELRRSAATDRQSGKDRKPER